MADAARGDLATDLALGAVAGVIGVWVLDRVDWWMYDHEAPETRERTDAVRPGGMDPAHVLAHRAAEAMGLDLPNPKQNAAGLAVHYAIGVAPAMAYAALRDRVPAVTAGRGAAFGLAMFLAEDEVLNPLAGLAARPQDYPWQDHARGLVAHLVFGVAVDGVLRALKGR